MEVKFKNNYVVNTMATYNSIVNLDVEKLIEKNKITNKEDLILEIEEYILNAYNARELINESDYENWNDFFDSDITILNIDEFILYLKEESCCDNQTTPYCSQCGKKLN